eukprot:COSAG06_NODE_42117_length_384_cov_1.610526_1_plen_41_part_10
MVGDLRDAAFQYISRHKGVDHLHSIGRALVFQMLALMSSPQ